MAPIIEQLLRLLSVPQGNVIYAMVLAICAFAAWLSCIYARGRRETIPGNRMQLGLLFLFIVQLVLFALSWLTGLGLIDGHTFLPPVDRLLALFSLVLIIWLWAVPDADRIVDAIIALVEVGIVIFGITGLALWLRDGANLSYTTSDLGGYAYFTGIGVLVVGIILLLWRRPAYWGYGLLMLVLFLAGYLAQYLIYQPPADYAMFVHLGEMAAFLFLLVLPKRLVGLVPKLEPRAPFIPLSGSAVRIDGRLVQTLTDLLTEPSPQKYYQELARLVGQLMNAEFCLLMIPPKTGEQIIVPVAYHAAQNMMIDGFTADGRKMPGLLAAIKSGRTLRLDGTTGNEARALCEELGMNDVSHLLVAPFHPLGTSAIMGIALLSVPQAPAWSDEDATQLSELTDTLLTNASRARAAGKTAVQEELEEKLARAEAYVDQVRLEYAQLKAKYDSLTTTAPEAPASSDIEKALEEDLARLESRNRELEGLLAKGRPSMEEVEQLRQELRAALVDLARIPSTLSKSDQKMLETQLSAVKNLDRMQPTELVTSIAQEFRQPLSSIVGYTDLLLGESVGLLGAVQRKFLERVKASTERMGFLLNELVEVMTIDGGKVDKTPVMVELEPIIHEAVGNIGAQLTDKNIHLQLDLPEILPTIQANKDAVLQILENLLENAWVITPTDGEIKLVASFEQREGEDNFILISVSDQGGGIDRADISRVFLRRYKMENPLIKGLGDSGVGLSIVKSLVELLKGRVWVDSQAEGSTFSVLLPLTQDQAHQTNLQISS